MSLAGISAIAWATLSDETVDQDTAQYVPRPLTAAIFAQRDRSASVEMDFGRSETPGPPAPTPQEAVDSFLAAEIAGDYVTSFGLLDEQDRELWPTAEIWENGHRALPIFTAAEPASPSGDDGLAVVVAVELEPRLDLVLGAVPETATTTWTPTNEDGGWRLSFSQTEIAAEYPEDSHVAQVAARWVETMQRCDDATELELTSGPLGSRVLADRLCGTRGPTSLGTVSSLEDFAHLDTVVNAFGPQSYDFARVISVSGPIEAQLALAPDGDHWLVVAVAETDGRS